MDERRFRVLSLRGALVDVCTGLLQKQVVRGLEVRKTLTSCLLRAVCYVGWPGWRQTAGAAAACMLPAFGALEGAPRPSTSPVATAQV